MYPLRFIGLAALLVSSTLLSAQKTVTVNAQMQHCASPPRLFTFDGTLFREAQVAGGEHGHYTFKVPADEPRFYYVGTDENTHTPVILGGESDVLLQGDCNNARAITVSGSLINQQYAALKNEFGRLNGLSQRANMNYRAAMSNPNNLDQAKQALAEVDQMRQHLLDSLRKTNPLLGRVASLNTYLSFPNHGQGRYPGELEYFATEFFRFVDWNDDAYNRLPWVFESFKSYATTLADVNLPDAQLLQIFDMALKPIPQGSGARKMALSGMLTTLQQKNNPAFAGIAERYIQEFGASDPAAVAGLQAEIKRMNGFKIGGEAPDFTQQTPDGQDFSLSQLRGKVVLIDFWASWCGPCRAENPNVVRLYDQYHSKGFEILGVSLDKTKDRWLQAIEQDGLKWLHVSDLLGWQNAVAQQYSVQSIPHTILLDAEGKIIARGLRGPALASKLAELFD